MKRREFLVKGSLATAAVGTPVQIKSTNKPVLTVAHITDAHIRPIDNIPARFSSCLQEVKKHKIDFVLNGGDSIFAADYKDVTREKMLEQWAAWDEGIKPLADYQIYSCVGNHDPWWQAPSKEDEMYGVGYVVKRVGMPNRYYSFYQKKLAFYHSGWQ